MSLVALLHPLVLAIRPLNVSPVTALLVQRLIHSTPATPDSLLIDTGSSNTWIGAGGSKYNPTKSSINTNDTMVSRH
jgi:hypothetical protein